MAFPTEFRHALPLPPALDTGGETLVDLLLAGLAERPMWQRFLSALAARLGARATFLVIEGIEIASGGVTASNTGVIAADPAEANRVAALLDLARLHDLPEAEPQNLSGGAWQNLTLSAVRIPIGQRRSAWLLAEGAANPALPSPAPESPSQPDRQGRAIMAALVPYLERVLPLYELVGASERHRLVAEYVLETSGVGVVLVEHDGRVVSANAMADAIFARSGLMSIRGGHLRAHARTAQRPLIEAINRMAALQASTADPALYTSVALNDGPEDDLEATGAAEEAGFGQRLTLIVRPGPPYGPVSAPLRRTAVVIVRDSARPGQLQARDLEHLFALSPAEARLASRLADGAGLDEAAAILGISRNTARSQLQAIYGKTGVNRQGDLVRLLLNSAAAHARVDGG